MSGLAYRTARAAWRVALFGFFRRIAVEGRERVPDGPVLLLPNHTNAFVDPLLVLTRLDREVTLTAKSTLRRNPLLAPLIRALGVVEFHRRSDVAEGAEPARNEEAMAEVVERLRRGGAACVFPEGVSHSDPELRPFRTGAARIALDHEASRGPSDPPLRLVPVGLHYERKERFRSSAALLFGQPFTLEEWRRREPEGGARELTAEIEARVRELTTNFHALRESQAMLFASDLLLHAGEEPAPLGSEERSEAERRAGLVRRLQRGAAALRATQPDRLAALERRVTALRRRLAALRVRPFELFLPLDWPKAAFFALREAELTLVGLPIAAWGALNHLPAYATVRALVRRMSRDPDHFASNAVFLSLPIFPLFWAAQVALVGAFFGVWAAAAYGLSLPYAGAVALLYRDRVGGAFRRSRTFATFVARPALRRDLREEATSIVAEIRELTTLLGPEATGGAR